MRVWMPYTRYSLTFIYRIDSDQPNLNSAVGASVPQLSSSFIIPLMFFVYLFVDFRIFASYIMERLMGVLRLCLAEDAVILTK